MDHTRGPEFAIQFRVHAFGPSRIQPDLVFYAFIADIIGVVFRAVRHLRIYLLIEVVLIYMSPEFKRGYKSSSALN